MASNSQYTSGLLSQSGLLTFDLSAVGGSHFDRSCKSLSTISFSGGGFAGGDQTTQGACGANIVYTYDEVTTPTNPVPEPATLALLGLGALGLAAARRRQSK